MPRIILIMTLFTLFSCNGKTRETSQVEVEVAGRAQAYISALNNQEIAALLSLWADEGEYRNPVTGKRVKGKNKIKNEYLAFFKEMKDSKAVMTIHSVSFPFQDKAVVEAAINLEGYKPYDLSILFLKQGEIWKILNINEINFLQ